MTISTPGRREEAAAEMHQIIEALQKRDPQAAEKASQEHVKRVARIVAERLREDNDLHAC